MADEESQQQWKCVKLLRVCVWVCVHVHPQPAGLAIGSDTLPTV